MNGRQLLLIRHGQASFGAADYDRLSSRGEAQARHLGEWLAATRSPPDLVAVGTLQRHRRTAELCLGAAGMESPQLEMPQLDEVDHEEILRRHRPDFASFDALRAEIDRAPDPLRAFQDLFVAAVGRWTGGAHDPDYRQTWPMFRARVLEALDVFAQHPARRIWAFTSGGPIGVIVNTLLDAPPERTFGLSWPLVNTSLTRITLGQGGTRLVSYNAWPHLETSERADLVTYR